MRSKLDDKSEKCIFVGYSERSKAYKLYNPKTNKIVISRDVNFDEKAAYNFSEVASSLNWQVLKIPEGDNIVDDDVVDGENADDAFQQNEDIEQTEMSTDDSPSPRRKKTKSLQELYESTKEITEENQVFFAFFAGESPIAFEEAIKEDKWIHAMKEEINAIEKNNTWELTNLPTHKTSISIK